MVLIRPSLTGTMSLSREFPSPYGDYGSYHYSYRTGFLHRQGSFRPLTGIMVLIKRKQWPKKEVYDSFRPLTGIMVLIRSRKRILVSRWKEGFPSPYGDYGSYPFFKSNRFHILTRFPSPYGDYGSYLNRISTIKSLQWVIVSVPLRGLWFLSCWNRW